MAPLSQDTSDLRVLAADTDTDTDTDTDRLDLTDVTGLPSPAVRRRLRWYLEVGFVLGFYSIYTVVRNTFGSATVSPERALENARDVIHAERMLGLFQEQRIQSLFLDWDWFMWASNVFYGTFHFAVTIFALVYLFRRHPDRYARFRTTLCVTTSAGLLGFSLYPLMPPRLLDDCTSAFGGCAPHGFVDSLARYGGLWSFDSGAMAKLSNQYAAMPSLHFGWSAWCALALAPVIGRRSLRVLLYAYPWITLFAIIVTANHYWLDALGGAFALACGFVVSGAVARLDARVQFGRLAGVGRGRAAAVPAPPGAAAPLPDPVDAGAPTRPAGSPAPRTHG
jgi:hypothetical protein